MENKTKLREIKKKEMIWPGFKPRTSSTADNCFAKRLGEAIDCSNDSNWASSYLLKIKIQNNSKLF